MDDDEGGGGQRGKRVDGSMKGGVDGRSSLTVASMVLVPREGRYQRGGVGDSTFVDPVRI